MVIDSLGGVHTWLSVNLRKYRRATQTEAKLRGLYPAERLESMNRLTSIIESWESLGWNTSVIARKRLAQRKYSIAVDGERVRFTYVRYRERISPYGLGTSIFGAKDRWNRSQFIATLRNSRTDISPAGFRRDAV